MKKVLSIVLVVTLALSLGTVALAAKEAAPAVELWTGGFGFHCNTYGGNGRVWTGAEDRSIALKNVGGTVYELQTGTADAIVCPNCERIDWVTYSNNNGKISGKNIQTNHSANPVYLATASATLVLKDVYKSLCEEEVKCAESYSEVVSTITKSGTFKTTDTAVFTFDIPDGYKLTKGSVNPVVFEFEAVAGQELSATITAVKVITIACTCPEEDDGEIETFPTGCEHIFLCSNCNGNGKQCLPGDPHGQCETSNQGSWKCMGCGDNANQIYGPKNVPSDLECGCPNK